MYACPSSEEATVRRQAWTSGPTKSCAKCSIAALAGSQHCVEAARRERRARGPSRRSPRLPDRQSRAGSNPSRKERRSRSWTSSQARSWTSPPPAYLLDPHARGSGVRVSEALREQPAHVMAAPGRPTPQIAAAACSVAEASGDLIAGAQLAAIVLEHASELVSFDRDFARFPISNGHAPCSRRAHERPGSELKRFLGVSED